MAVEHSRGLRLGAGVTGRSESALEAALDASRVVISVDTHMPMSFLTLRVLLTTLRRGLGGLVLERGGLTGPQVDALVEAVNQIDPDRPLVVTHRAGGEAPVRLHVGLQHGGAIRLVPEGYGGHVVRQRSAVIRPTRAANALGAIFTAALGATEAFKWTAKVLPARRVLHRHLRFCPVTLTSDLDRAPDLAKELAFDLALIGVGAIGTGIVLILDALDTSGRLLAVDQQRFGPENRGTYSIGTAADAASCPWKVDLAHAALRSYDVIRFCEPVATLAEAVDDGRVPWFRTILTALDSSEARRDAQRIWPDRLIDAGTGDTVLGIHDYEYGGRCMFCFFPPDRAGPSAAERLAQATGLPLARAMRGDEPLIERDLDGLDATDRKRLEPHLGKPVCGLAQTLRLTTLQAGDYQPSTPFVSLQAACLAVGRLLGDRMRFRSRSNLVQYDALIGPQRATIEQMGPLPGCTCQTRTTSIEEVRTRRSGRSY